MNRHRLTAFARSSLRAKHAGKAADYPAPDSPLTITSFFDN